jgi:molecular chaperone DnaK
MAVKLGIDLGTTYSAVSHFDGDRVVTLELDSADGGKLAPSVVFYEMPNAKPIVGTAAMNAFKSSPGLVVRGIKKHMGTGKTTDEIHGRRYSPQEVSAEILRALVEDARQKLYDDSIRDVVITVPAYFGDQERAATEEAAKMAGLNLMAIISEPLAASLAYSLETAGEIKTPYVLVYDLGGGTFDVTLIRTVERRSGKGVEVDLETIVKDGNKVGGLDWDRLLFDHLADIAKRNFQLDLRSDSRLSAEAIMECERAKRDLTKREKVILSAGAVTNQVEITRKEFEELTHSLMLQTKLLLESVLKEAEAKGIQREDITIVLAGGSSRMPCVSAMIEGVMKKKPLMYKDPDMLVTLGAAYFAVLLEKKEILMRTAKDPKGTPTRTGTLTDISNQPVGVEIIRDGGTFNAVVIPAGAQFGQEYNKAFASSDDNMTEIEIILYEGPESPNPEESPECSRLLSCRISGLPEGRPKGSKVEVALKWDGNGILSGRAVDVKTGLKADILLDRRAPKVLAQTV